MTTEPNPIFSVTLKRERLAKRMSQRKLAAASDMSATFLSKIEKGQMMCGVDKMIKMAEVLCIPYTVLLKASGKCLHCLGSGKERK